MFVQYSLGLSEIICFLTKYSSLKNKIFTLFEISQQLLNILFFLQPSSRKEELYTTKI
jgi:hypothetical protein